MIRNTLRSAVPVALAVLSLTACNTVQGVGKDLKKARMENLDLSGCELRNCCLDSASLAQTRFIAADLRGSTFFGTDLTGADLREAAVDIDALRHARNAEMRR